MKKLIFILFSVLLSLNVLAQNSETDSVQIKNVINKMFDGMRKGDSSIVSSTFAKGMILQTIRMNGDSVSVESEDPGKFLSSVGTKHTQVYDERITFKSILIDANMASVWTDYQFYLGDKFSHCGVNSFQLVKGQKGWQIVHIIDTRRKDDCN